MNRKRGCPASPVPHDIIIIGRVRSGRQEPIPRCSIAQVSVGDSWCHSRHFNLERIMSENPFARYAPRLFVATLLLAGALLSCSPSAGQGPKGKRPDFIPDDYDDYQYTLTKLG